jgi:hypothetical protein
MIRYSTRRATFARLLPVTLALGALHCDGGATIIREVPAPAPTGSDPPDDPEGGPAVAPNDDPPPGENGEGNGPLPIDPSNGGPPVSPLRREPANLEAQADHSG